MNTHIPPAELDRIVEILLPRATRRSIRALWRVGGSQQYINNIMMESNAYLGDIESEIATAQTVYRDVIEAFTGQEIYALADRLDAEEEAIDHLQTSPNTVALAATALTTLFEKVLFIETEIAANEFGQRVPQAEVMHEKSCLMVGGVTITIDALDQISYWHPDVDRDEISLPSRDTSWL